MRVGKNGRAMVLNQSEKSVLKAVLKFYFLLRDLLWMEIKLLGYLLDTLDAFERFECHMGFKCIVVSFSVCFHFGGLGCLFLTPYHLILKLSYWSELSGPPLSSLKIFFKNFVCFIMIAAHQQSTFKDFNIISLNP